MLLNFISFLYRLCLLFLSLVDAEKIHKVFIGSIKVLGRRTRKPSARFIFSKIFQDTKIASTPLELFGLKFSHPVGLAAGLDKNAEAIEGLQLLDFSFIEVGTITPLAQNGNPKPRLYRNYSDRMIFNAMGFNNIGIEEVKRNINASRPYFNENLVLGINIGKNAGTSIEEAWKDYARCARDLKDEAHYLTINVSSPNTAGLRALQHSTTLAPILEGVFNETQKSQRSTPVLVKLAPELNEDFLAELITTLEAQFPLAGWILTNTLQRPSPFPKSSMPSGGISGAPLTLPARQALVVARKHSKKVLISSGGILDGAEAKERLRLGASLVQIYSGLIFRGPAIVSEILNKISF